MAINQDAINDVISGNKPEELYTIDLLVAIRPNPHDVSQVHLIGAKKFVWAKDATHAALVFGENMPSDDELNVVAVIAIRPVGDVQREYVIEPKPSALGSKYEH